VARLLLDILEVFGGLFTLLIQFLNYLLGLVNCLLLLLSVSLEVFQPDLEVLSLVLLLLDSPEEVRVDTLEVGLLLLEHLDHLICVSSCHFILLQLNFEFF
jgi:hypothetical protein